MRGLLHSPPFVRRYSVYLCVNGGLWGLLAVALPALFVPQPAMSLGPAALPRVLCALAGVAQWIEREPANQRVAGLIPSQGTCLGCRPVPQ